jgi:hypothetical protein
MAKVILIIPKPRPPGAISISRKASDAGKISGIVYQLVTTAESRRAGPQSQGDEPRAALL